jgi:hypothetical protein
MAKILVEVDIHGGLSESLDIEWHGMVFTKRLDYLGIPFCCSHCRQTGHLRKDCHHPVGEPIDVTSSEENFTNGYSLELEP